MQLEKKHTKTHTRSIIYLISTLIGITLIYQARPFLDDSQFMWISVPSYSIIPGLLVVLSSILAVKLHKQNHFQSKAFLLFAIGAMCWFSAEQIWAIYDHIYDMDPFPSEADIFYMAAYPFFVAFLLISLKPVRKSISKKVWMFAMGLSISFLIPSFSAAYDDMEGEHAFDTSIALSYPILAAFQITPAIIGIMFLAKRGANYSWMLLLFGFLIYSVSDTFFLFAELDGNYYDGHPVDLMYLYSFILLIFSLENRLKLAYTSNDKNQGIFFSENIQFETISKYGIPLTLIIVSMVVLISLTSLVYVDSEESLSIENIMMGVFAMLAVFTMIVLTVNKSLTKMVYMRTRELEEQKNNLENLVEEKTHEVLKAERLSAIGELSGRLAHDLRNPLSVMKMSVDLIKQHPADTKISDTVITKRLDLIEKSIERISHQVDDVLDYVRNSPLKLEPVSLRKTLLNSIDKISIPHDIKIAISGDDKTIDCDLIKMDAVFINLIINSIQAMDNGGDIQIKISQKYDDVIIDFVDSGPGIPDAVKDKIFEPLFTTKQKGTGLGLASCKNIVEQHGGRITVSNNPTTFTIRLPKSDVKLYDEISTKK
ncbi:HAMP domain-containing histidine kinase [Nitrosopumilus sp. K4]|uniref:sensor histidine kinase n=1 Tax=Nitrosopumilus sp. K4 TaxID=2795383 RepID=UPI001BA46FED|nr:HAMP domain-containing sensor histidine kinase [Nitrosopumilus sp. K4]QUC64357.1 HAMP domain-containing histidine kinase [Nitrosopumilus sp. K4]